MTTAKDHQKRKLDRLIQQVRDDMHKHTAAYPNIYGVTDAFARLMGNMSIDRARGILNSELGKNLERRKLGKSIHYNRDQLPEIIATFFLNESTPLKPGVPDMTIQHRAKKKHQQPST